MRRSADSQEAAGDLFEATGPWRRAAAGLQGRLAEPGDLTQDNLSLVQSLAPEKTRAALALLDAGLMRPRGAGVSVMLVVRDGPVHGLAITVRDLRGRLPRRRIEVWPDEGPATDAPGVWAGLAEVGARCAAIECVRRDLLEHTSDRRGSRARSTPVEYTALTRGLVGRQYARSARRFPGFTCGLYRRAIEEYTAALTLVDDAPQGRDPEKLRAWQADARQLEVWRAFAEGELARRLPPGQDTAMFDTAIDDLERALRPAGRHPGLVDVDRWTPALTTLLLLRADMPNPPARIVERTRVMPPRPGERM